MAVPLNDKNGIKARFNITLVIAPYIVHFTTVLILPIGYRTCIPIILESPTTKVIGAIICEVIMASSYWLPQKTLTIYGAMQIRPITSGMVNASVKSYDF